MEVREKVVTTMGVMPRGNTPTPTLQSLATIATRLATFPETVLKRENHVKTTLKEANQDPSRSTITTTTANQKATLATSAGGKDTFRETALRESSASSASREVTSLMNAKLKHLN